MSHFDLDLEWDLEWDRELDNFDNFDNEVSQISSVLASTRQRTGDRMTHQ